MIVQQTDGFYRLHRINQIGKHQLVPSTVLNICSHHIDRNQYRCRYALDHTSNYPWVSRLWKQYMELGDVPPLQRSPFRQVVYPGARRIVSLIFTHEMVYRVRSKTKHLSSATPFRCDSPAELEAALTDVITNICRTADRVFAGTPGLDGDIRSYVNAIIIYDDCSYDTKSISTMRLATLCGAEIVDVKTVHVPLRKDW